ncbi:MAG: N-acetylornithine carbamoyltransferase [Candidatus Thorarchaeota archaeon]|jgi:N-acetylornithine carbamoyltransferase
MTSYVGIFKGRDWLETQSWSQEDLKTLIDAAKDLKKKYKSKVSHSDILRDRTLFMIFFNRSLRTRNSFEGGITQLGGHGHFLSPQDIYVPALPEDEEAYKTERIADVARCLNEMGDAIAIRLYGDAAKWQYGRGHRTLQEFAKWSDIPVINMEDDVYHPCQALADIQAIDEHVGKFQGKKYVMSWAFSEGLKPLAVPQSCILSATKMGMDVTFARPKGFELDDKIINYCKENADRFGGSFEETDNMEEAFEGAHVVYPKSWTARAALPGPWGGPSEPDKKLALEYARKNKSWICDQAKMDLTSKATYMHCLPADRGMEVTDEVIDGPQSIVFDEAGNRMHSQKALMAAIM